MPTVLRLTGPADLLGPAVKSSPFQFVESIQSRKCRASGAGSATYNITVSDADGGSVPLQIDHATEFLARNRDHLEQLLRSSPAERRCLDISWDFPSSAIGQANRFPLELLSACTQLGIEIEISVYGIAPVQE